MIKSILGSRKKSPGGRNADAKLSELSSPEIDEAELSTDLEHNAQLLKKIFANCSDIIFRDVETSENKKMLAIFTNGLISTVALEQLILEPVIGRGSQVSANMNGANENTQHHQMPVGQSRLESHVGNIVTDILKGSVAILVDGESKAMLADLGSVEKRSISEPSTETVIRGPREGFIEVLNVNMALLRRKIHSPRLKMESMVLGEITKTDIIIAYIDGLADAPKVEEVRKRVSEISIDSVLESMYIEEFIQDSLYSPFPQVLSTERPDVVAAGLLEGKIAILIEGTPFALMVPLTFWSFMQSPEDYYQNMIYSTVVRWLRYVFLTTSIYLPSIYVATTTFHPQLIPASLLLSIAAAREGIPFPAMVEALLMEFMFEGLREAGIRLPKQVGPAVSIVGALVIGDAAVRAGIVSAPMVIVVATTGIASFGIPRYQMGITLRLLRFPMLFLAGGLGLFGIALGTIVLIIHLVTLTSVGVPYFNPVGPQFKARLKDVFMRAPLKAILENKRRGK